MLVVTNFFNDYCQLELEELSNSTRSTRIGKCLKARRLFFSTKFVMLEAQISFKDAGQERSFSRVDGIKQVAQGRRSECNLAYHVGCYPERQWIPSNVRLPLCSTLSRNSVHRSWVAVVMLDSMSVR